MVFLLMAAIWNTFLQKNNHHTPVTTPKPVKMHDCNGFQSSGFHLIEINVANTTFGITAGDLIWGIAILLTCASILYCLYKKFDIFKCVKDYRRGGNSNRDEDVEMASDRSRKVIKRMRKMGPSERKSVLMEFEKKKESPPVIVQVGEGLRVETKNRDKEEDSESNKVFPSKTPWQDKN